MIYVDGKEGTSYVKRFQVNAVTRDREYELTKGNASSKVIYFTANPNAEAEIVTINLTPACKAKLKTFDYNFAEIEIKGRGAQGNILTKYPIRKVSLKSEGASTMGGLNIWYDESIGRLNTDGRGKKLGKFEGEENILVVYKDGQYELTNYELTNRYEPNDITLIEKFDPATVISAIHYDGNQSNFFVKRFRIETTSVDKKFSFISDAKGSRLVVVSTDRQPQVEVTFKKTSKDKEESQLYDLDMLTEVRGWKALGNKLSNYKVLRVKMLASKPERDIEKIIVHATPEMKEEAGEVKVNQLGIF
jgi:topoisomerase-4 subunit A